MRELPKPYPKQEAVLQRIREAKRGERLLLGYGGAMNSAKTGLISLLAWQLAIEYPGAKIVVARDSMVNLRATTMENFYRFAPLEGAKVADGGIIVRRDEQNLMYCDIRLPQWPEGVVSRVYFRGLQNINFFGSIEITALLVDEADQIPLRNVLYALTRLRQRLPDGRLPKWVAVFASNPWPGWFDDYFVQGGFSELLTALNKELEDQGEEPAPMDVAFIPAADTDNLGRDVGYRNFMQAILPEGMFKSLGEGSFQHIEGRIFPLLNRNTHMLSQHKRKATDGSEIPGITDWPAGTLRRAVLPNVGRVVIPRFKFAYGGLDFAGMRADANLSTGVASIVLHNGVDIRVSGWSGRGPHVFDNQETWMRQVELGLGCRVNWGADKSQPTGIQALRRRGFAIRPSEGRRDSWRTIVHFMRARFAPWNDGLPRSFFLDSMPREWLKQMTAYRTDPNPNAKGELSERPVGQDDDFVDADRYAQERLARLVGFDPRMRKSVLNGGTIDLKRIREMMAEMEPASDGMAVGDDELWTPDRQAQHVPFALQSQYTPQEWADLVGSWRVGPGEKLPAAIGG